VKFCSVRRNSPVLLDRGLHFYLPLTTKIRKLPRQLQAMELSEKPATDPMGETISVDGVIAVRYTNPLKVVMVAEEGSEWSVIWSVALPLFWVLASKAGVEALADDDEGAINELLKKRLQSRVQAWGIEIVEASIVVSKAHVIHHVGRGWGGGE